MYNKQFNELAVGNVFRLNGNIYVKQSSRTAWLVEYNRWFYFGKRENVELLLDGRFSFTPLVHGKYQVYFCNEYIATGIDKLDAINKAIAFDNERMKAYR